MTNFSAVDARKKPFLWIDALIDDWGLSPSEMRVYLSVVRRAGSSKCSDGRFFESIGNLAKRLGLSDKTVSRCLKTLVAANIIARCCRAGKTNEYRLMDSSDWKALERESDRPQTGEPEVLMSGNEQKFSTTPDISTVPPRTSRPYDPDP